MDVMYLALLFPHTLTLYPIGGEGIEKDPGNTPSPPRGGAEIRNVTSFKDSCTNVAGLTPVLTYPPPLGAKGLAGGKASC